MKNARDERRKEIEHEIEDQAETLLGIGFMLRDLAAAGTLSPDSLRTQVELLEERIKMIGELAEDYDMVMDKPLAEDQRPILRPV